MTITLTDKNTFQQIKKYASDISNEFEIENSFPFLCLKIFFDLSNEEIENALKGLGSDDQSIDAFWIDDDDQVIHIAQFKSVKNEKRVKESYAEKPWFTFLKDVPNKLQNTEWLMNECKNLRIRNEISYDFMQAKNDNYSLILHLFHMGNATREILASYQDVLYYSFDDIKEQFNEYCSRSSISKPDDCEIALSYPEVGEKLLKFDFKYLNSYKNTFIAIITGSEIIKLRKKYRYELFNRNVRYYLGVNNKINKNIIDTALDKPELFYCYNNGITITCDRCIEKNNNLKLIKPQIINGAQTVNSLYAAYETKVKELKKGRSANSQQEAESGAKIHFNNIKLLCRIVTSTQGDTTNFATELTKYTNSQNDVKVFDFCSNRPEQIEIQKKLADYGYFYERKRGEREYIKKEPHEDFHKKLNDFIHYDVKIDIKTLAGIYHAFLGYPSYPETDYKTILSDYKREDYKRIFGSSKADVSPEKIKNMIFAINIVQIVKEQIKLYDKTYKIYLRYIDNTNDIDILDKLLQKIEELKFINYQQIQNVINKNNRENIQKIIKEEVIDKYDLISRGTYMLTAMIKYICDENGYTEDIIINELFDNEKILKQNFVMWIKPLIIKILNNVYKNIAKEKSISCETFYKRKDTFSFVKERIQSLCFDDDWDLKEKFPFTML